MGEAKRRQAAYDEAYSAGAALPRPTKCPACGSSRIMVEPAPALWIKHTGTPESMRAKAVKLGAVEITFRECSMMTVRRRREGPAAPLVSPVEGEAIYQEQLLNRSKKWRANGGSDRG